MLQVTQSVIAGVPLPDVAGSAIAVIALPPNSPVMTPVWVPCAMATPLAPAARLDSVSIWFCDGAVHVPEGEPGVNFAWLRSATNTLDGSENSAGASAMPVAQSSPDESSSP